MRRAKRSRALPLQLEELEPRLAPAAPVGTLESFDTTASGALPASWSQWSSMGTNAFAVSSAQALSAPNSLAVSSPTASGLNARAWLNTAQPANEEVQSAVYLNSPIPAEILARGSGLNTTTPSYYAASITQGLDLKLLRVQNGTTTTLGEVKSSSWIANQWVYVTLYANGNNVRAQVQRNDTGQYLNGSGQWQSNQTWALNLTDTSPLNGGGDVGLGRLPSYTGGVNFDNFSYGQVTVSSQPPAVTILVPPTGSTVSGVVPVQVSATDPTGVSRVEFYIDNVLRRGGGRSLYLELRHHHDRQRYAHLDGAGLRSRSEHRPGVGDVHHAKRFHASAPTGHPAQFAEPPPGRHRLQRQQRPARSVRHSLAAKQRGSRY